MNPRPASRNQSPLHANWRYFAGALAALSIVWLLASPETMESLGISPAASDDPLMTVVNETLDEADQLLTEIGDTLLPTDGRTKGNDTTAPAEFGEEPSHDSLVRQSGHWDDEVAGDGGSESDQTGSTARVSRDQFGRAFWTGEVTDDELVREQQSFARYETASRSRRGADRQGNGIRVAQGVVAGPAPIGPPPPPTIGPAPPAGPIAQPGTSGSTPASTPPAAAATATPPAATAATTPKGKATLKAATGKVMERVNLIVDSGVYGGASVSFLAPLREPEQQVSLQDLTTGQIWQQDSVTGLGTGARMWLGIMPESQGFRAQVFTMAIDEVRLQPTVPLMAKPSFTSVSHLDIDAIDLEYTQIFGVGAHCIESSLGVRFAEVSVQSNTVGYGDVGNGVSLYGLAMAACEMQGIGFTGSLGGHISLIDIVARSYDDKDKSAAGQNHFPNWLAGWGLFYMVRGSVLWSETSVGVLTDANAVTQGSISGSAFTRNQATVTDDSQSVTGNFELNFGLEYERCLERLPSTLIFRAGFEYQRWSLGELAANSRSAAFLVGGEPPFGGAVVASADRADDYLDLFGIMVSVGLTY